MAEQQGRAGDKGEERIIALLEGLNWKHRGDTNIDIKYDYKYHPDRSDTYGVDGYMTYDGPYREKERGFLIESKNTKWDSYGPKKFKKWSRQILEKVEAVPESEDFENYLNFDKPRIVNAGLLSVWTRDKDEFNQNKFHEYVTNVPIRPKKRRKFQILVLGNTELNRLASLHSEFQSLENQDDTKSIEFFYPARADSHTSRLSVLTLEYMLSDYVFARAEREKEVSGISLTEDVGVVFFFDELKLDALNFMYRAVLEHGIDDVDELIVFVYDESNEDIQLESVKREFLENGLPVKLSGDEPTIDIRTMRSVDYANHTEKLMEGK